MMPVAPPENLSSHLAALTAAYWPRFSDAEMTRRYTAIDGLMAEAGIRHLMVYGAQWNGAAKTRLRPPSPISSLAAPPPMTVLV
jgi:hypothetical protein